jgi:rsbT co-antagonist protein RsbR
MNTQRAEPLLEALREPAAILDTDGRVVSANTRFTGLDIASALAGARFAPGSDYLQACALAREDDGQMAAFSHGVREVLAGRAPSFTQEYDRRGAPPRSFEVVVSAYHASGLDGALVVHYETTERKRIDQARHDTEERLEFISRLMPDGYWTWDLPTGNCFYSPRWCESLGYTPEEIAPHIDTWVSLVHPDDLPRAQEALKAHWERRTGVYQSENRLRMKDGSYRWSLDQGTVVSWDAESKPLKMIGIPINDEVVVMPLVGMIDPSRAQQILTSLLEGLSQRRAKVAILDITGVSDMDGHVASVLVNMAKAVQLLGSQIVLTGIRPEVATLLIQFDVDWRNIVVRGTLQSGIAYATGAGRG